MSQWMSLVIIFTILRFRVYHLGIFFNNPLSLITRITQGTVRVSIFRSIDLVNMNFQLLEFIIWLIDFWNLLKSSYMYIVYLILWFTHSFVCWLIPWCVNWNTCIHYFIFSLFIQSFIYSLSLVKYLIGSSSSTFVYKITCI